MPICFPPAMSRNARIDARSGKARKGSGCNALCSTNPEISSSISSGQFFVAMENRVHRDNVEGSVVAQRAQRDARVLVNVAFADLDEAAELGEARKPHRDRFAGERVQHHIDALAVGQIHYRLSEITATRVDHVFHAERFEQSAFARAAGAGDHFRAEMKRNLDRGHSDAARAGMNENALALAQARHVLQRMPRGHEDDRHSGRRFKSQACRNAPHVTAARDCVRGKAENGETKNTIARSNVRDVRDQLALTIPPTSSPKMRASGASPG